MYRTVLSMFLFTFENDTLIHYTTFKNSKNSLTGHLKLDKSDAKILSNAIQKQIYFSRSLLMRGEIYQFPLEKD